jgi:hypothetical protein
MRVVDGVELLLWGTTRIDVAFRADQESMGYTPYARREDVALVGNASGRDGDLRNAPLAAVCEAFEQVC